MSDKSLVLAAKFLDISGDTCDYLKKIKVSCNKFHFCRMTF